MSHCLCRFLILPLVRETAISVPGYDGATVSLFAWLRDWHEASHALLLSLIWVAHIGCDRMLEFGLKYPTRFKDTHLNPGRHALEIGDSPRSG